MSGGLAVAHPGPLPSAPRRALIPGLLLAVGGVVGVHATTAPAQAAERCAPGTGVTVVVDFGPLGGGAREGCDSSGAGDAASRVVPRAGFPLTYAAGQPFVCRISGLPDASREDCADTPPADAYWAVFWSDGKRGTWTYASEGVTSLDVPAGGSIGFRFQGGGGRTNPSLPPNTGTAPKPEPTKPTKAPKPTPEPAKAAVTPSQSAAPTASASPSGTPSGRPAETRAADRAEKRPEKRPVKRSDEGGRARKEDRKAAAKADRRDARESDSGAADDEQVSAEAVAQEETPLAPASATDDGGGALTWAAGGAVLLLVAAAGVLARRRRG